LRRIALNVGRHHPGTRHGICTCRLPAGWDDAYLLELLTGL